MTDPVVSSQPLSGHALSNPVLDVVVPVYNEQATASSAEPPLLAQRQRRDRAGDWRVARGRRHGGQHGEPSEQEEADQGERRHHEGRDGQPSAARRGGT